MNNKLTYEKLMDLADTIKICSGCDEVKLVGNHKTFEEMMTMGIPLTDFKCEEVFEFDESQLYIMPIDNWGAEPMDDKKFVTIEMFEQYHKKLMGYIGMHDDLILNGETTCPKCGATITSDKCEDCDADKEVNDDKIS